MARKTILTQTHVKAILPSSLYEDYLLIQEKLKTFKSHIPSLEIDPKMLEDLFPNKKGYQIEVCSDGQLALVPIPLSELRKKAKELGLDISHLGRKRNEILKLISQQESEVDALESHPIDIPKIGKP